MSYMPSPLPFQAAFLLFFQWCLLIYSNLLSKYVISFFIRQSNVIILSCALCVLVGLFRHLPFLVVIFCSKLTAILILYGWYYFYFISIHAKTSLGVTTDKQVVISKSKMIQILLLLGQSISLNIFLRADISSLGCTCVLVARLVLWVCRLSFPKVVYAYLFLSRCLSISFVGVLLIQHAFREFNAAQVSMVSKVFW